MKSMDRIDQRILALQKLIESRTKREPEYRSGAVKFSDAVIELQAYLAKEQRRLNKGQK